jgi:hypothetical protein
MDLPKSGCSDRKDSLAAERDGQMRLASEGREAV